MYCFILMSSLFTWPLPCMLFISSTDFDFVDNLIELIIFQAREKWHGLDWSWIIVFNASDNIISLISRRSVFGWLRKSECLGTIIHYIAHKHSRFINPVLVPSFSVKAYDMEIFFLNCGWPMLNPNMVVRGTWIKGLRLINQLTTVPAHMCSS